MTVSDFGFDLTWFDAIGLMSASLFNQGHRMTLFVFCYWNRSALLNKWLTYFRIAIRHQSLSQTAQCKTKRRVSVKERERNRGRLKNNHDFETLFYHVNKLFVCEKFIEKKAEEKKSSIKTESASLLKNGRLWAEMVKKVKLKIITKATT